MDEHRLLRLSDLLAMARSQLFNAEARLSTIETEARRVKEDILRLQRNLREGLTITNRPLGRCWHGQLDCRICKG